MRRPPAHTVVEGDTFSMNEIPLSYRSFELLLQCGVTFEPVGHSETSFHVEWVAQDYTAHKLGMVAGWDAAHWAPIWGVVAHG